MKNSQKFIKLLESKRGLVIRKKYYSNAERFGWIKDYTGLREKTELHNYEKFINSRRAEILLEDAKVKTYCGDNQY